MQSTDPSARQSVVLDCRSPRDDASSTSAGRHAPELDALRAVAIFSVLLNHFLPESDLVNRAQASLHTGPPFGVPLFFSLSGFLITRILAQSRASIIRGITTTKHSLFIFYARRFLRIFPVYYATLAIGFVLNFPNLRRAIFWHFAYLSNFYYAHRGAFDRGPAPVFWTLSVEEQFYLIWPVLFFLLPVRWLAPFALLATALGSICAGYFSPRTAAFNTLLQFHLPFLALGSILGMAGVAPFGSEAVLRRTARGFLIGFAAFMIAFLALRWFAPVNLVTHRTAIGVRYTAIALAGAWIVVRLACGVGGPIGGVLRWTPLTFIGKISYGMYIFQFFVKELLDRAVPAVSARIGVSAASWLLQSFPARCLALIAVAGVSYLFFEKPLNDLKRYFPYARSVARPDNAGSNPVEGKVVAVPV
jgi:peptidoglycan/LPS O-acetylase OafA/YrhL